MKNRNNKNDGVHPQTPSSPSCFFRCHCLHCPEVLSSTVLAPGQSQPLYLCLRAHPFSPIQSYHSSCFPLSFINISFFWIIPISMLLFLPSEKKKKTFLPHFIFQLLSHLCPLSPFLIQNSCLWQFLLFSSSLSIFLLPPSQAGFCPYNSTNVAFVKIPCPLCCSVQGQFSVLILFDQSKAFDTGNHDFVKYFRWLLGHHTVLDFP